MIERSLSVDVSGVFPAGAPCELSGTLWSPDAHELGESQTVIVAVPGGTYTRAYWDPDLPGKSDYSFAAYMCGRGHMVVSFDNLGTGASTAPTDSAGITHEVTAAANGAAIRQVAERLRSGSLGLPPLPRLRLIGVGHSLGGQFVVVQQAREPLYERLAILGTSFMGNANNESDDSVTEAQELESAEGMLEQLTPDWAAGKPYLTISRDATRSMFHADDVPDDVLAADRAAGTVIVRGIASRSITTKVLATYARSVEVPVLLAFADLDMSPDPRAETAIYSASRDVTLFLLPGSSHCHNSASTRHTLWRRIAEWVEGS